MSNPLIITLASVFYLLLVIGAITRFRRNRNFITYLQALGVLLPILPTIAMMKFGISSSLIIAYALLWLPMGIGYVLEGFREK